ncbi:TLDc domain-containing protein [Entamoeba marina]
MIDKETIIFNKNEDEFKRQANQRKHKFDEKLQNINQMKYQLDDVRSPILKELYPNDTKIQQDKEIVELIPSFNKLKEWSGKQKCSIIFDSKIDGDGGNNVLMNKVMNKQNLYFISFDNQNNVFGGYVDTIINKTGDWITDPNAFVFSLIRNGKMKNIKYEIKNSQYAFYSLSNDNQLYGIGGGHDIGIWKIGDSNSYCNPHSYEYNGEQHPIVDKFNFTTKRILVIQMN